jgi:mannose/cellobiose epimerase-like protein (N-acyl-D-glucosamine 2-epimerase family)
VAGAVSSGVAVRDPGGREYLRAQRADLLRFGARSRHQQGFGWLDDSGVLDDTMPVQLWVTCRMTHVFALGAMADETPAVGGPDTSQLYELAAHGVASLSASFADHEQGGWFAALGPDVPADDSKSAYAHAFVVLAACSAAVAEVEGADALLARALATSELRFWDDEHGMVVDAWNRDWTVLDPYRGVNATMHTVEAYLAAADVTGDAVWAERALRMVRRVRDVAAAYDCRIPEHYDENWVALPDYHRGTPADPFRPYGATVGHGLEWARLLVATAATVQSHGRPDLLAGLDLTDDAVRLADRAIADGWAVDGADGFVYTTDWDGVPVVRHRMHWVVAEALNTGWALDQALGEPRYADRVAQWWDYADRHLVDGLHGSWHHELAPDNTPTASTWTGKPDIYHAYQAALIPTLPLTPVLAVALGGLAG